MKKLYKIKDYPNYGINRDGQVYSFKAKRFLKPKIHYKQGYSIINLSKNNKAKTFRVHRLMVNVFYGGLQKGMETNHKNGIKSDNSLKNLEIITPEENRKHAYRVLGVLISSKKIIQYDKNGHMIKRWDSISQAARILKITKSNILDVLAKVVYRNNETKKRITAGGFIWKYDS